MNAPLARQLIWIDPRKITHWIEGVNNPKFRYPEFASALYENLGYVLDGDWDLSAEPMPMNPTIHAHFVEGVPWADLNLAYDEQLNHEGYDQMYADIKRYQRTLSQRERLPFYKRIFREEAKHEVVIHIGRNGELLRKDGHHRLSITKLAGAKLIPAQIGCVHLQVMQSGIWNKLMVEFKQNAIRARTEFPLT